MRLKPVCSAAFAAVLSVAGCSRRHAPSPVPPRPSAAPQVVAPVAPPASRRTDAIFSLPIAAARQRAATWVAGFVPSSGSVRVVALLDDGGTWSRDVISGASWTPDAQLRLESAGEGVTLGWAARSGPNGFSELYRLGPTGDVQIEVHDVGSDWCATEEGVAWVSPHRKAPARALWRSWSDAAQRELAVIPDDRTPSISCADRAVYALGDGDDDLRATPFVPSSIGSAARHVTVMRSADFEDDEQEHRELTIGDDLEIVRVGATGSIAIREVKPSGEASPWRRARRSLGEDDDLVAADGDDAATVLLFTRAAEQACPGATSPAEQVHALRIDRRTGAAVALDLAPIDCARSVGPFWLGELREPRAEPAGAAAAIGAGTESAPVETVVTWAERRTALARSAPAVRGLGYRLLRSVGDGGAADVTIQRGAIAFDADAVVGAGCDAAGCFAAALARDEAPVATLANASHASADAARPGADAMQPGAEPMQPGAIVVTRYP